MAAPAAATALALLALAVVAPPAAAQNSVLGKYFKLCSLSDPQVEQCILETLNGAQDHLANGIPELGLVPLDPMFVRSVRVEEGPGDIQLQFAIKNSTYTGLKGSTVTRVRFDVPRKYLEIETIMPRLTGKGRYSFGGRLLTLRIQGNGPYEVECGNLNVTHKIDFEEVTLNGEPHWLVKKYDFDMEMQTFKGEFRNLFRGNNRLGQYANNYINRNWRPGYTIYKHVIGAAVGNVFKNTTNPMLEKVPLKQMFLP